MPFIPFIQLFAMSHAPLNRLVSNGNTVVPTLKAVHMASKARSEPKSNWPTMPDTLPTVVPPSELSPTPVAVFTRFPTSPPPPPPSRLRSGSGLGAGTANPMLKMTEKTRTTLVYIFMRDFRGKLCRFNGTDAAMIG